ncbi:hypothetical protein ACIBQ6_22070 [Nonomuraea sp. NPDC049655]|uniref:hypothetical protein n=1 Tax=Nonomuraea sp. NPDC049655 TaxID=3364355 RepID=UPI003798C08D
MKVTADQLIAALTDSRFYLEPEEGGINLHCQDCYSNRLCKPLAHYDLGDDGYQLYRDDPAIANVTTIPSLWDEAAKHLESAHQNGSGT